MSGILKRTVFVAPIPYTNGEKSGATVMRFADLASVVTGIGQMLEPYTFNLIHSPGVPMPADLDPKDMMRRVDVIRNSTRTNFGDNGQVLHRMEQWVRVGP